MSSVASRGSMWVVLDGADRVVLMCSGADAGEVAEEWRERGYRVLPVDAVGVHAA